MAATEQKLLHFSSTVISLCRCSHYRHKTILLLCRWCEPGLGRRHKMRDYCYSVADINFNQYQAKTRSNSQARIPIQRFQPPQKRPRNAYGHITWYKNWVPCLKTLSGYLGKYAHKRGVNSLRPGFHRDLSPTSRSIINGSKDAHNTSTSTC